MKIKKFSFLLALMVSNSIFAKETIICHSAASDEMMLQLDAGRLKGKTVSCISGKLWAVDGNNCSANGYYALHGNSGVLSSFKKRWQDTSEGDTLTYFGKSNSDILFSASGVLAGGNGMEFNLNRSTGRAILKDHNLNVKVVFSCSKVK